MLPTPGFRRADRSRVALATVLALWTAAVPSQAVAPGGEAPGAVEASASGPVEARIVVETLVEVPGPGGAIERRFVEARRLQAGQAVYYTIRVTNPGQGPVDDVVVVKRMPSGVDYVPGSATGPACEVGYSTDNGATFAAKGRTGGFTHLRWSCRRPLAPGATALLRFRAVFR